MRRLGQWESFEGEAWKEGDFPGEGRDPIKDGSQVF